MTVFNSMLHAMLLSRVLVVVWACFAAVSSAWSGSSSRPAFSGLMCDADENRSAIDRSRDALKMSRVTFDHPDGPYTGEMHRADFGANPPAATRAFASVVDGALRVALVQGQKVNQTGYSAHVPVEPAREMTLRFRVRYPEDFEPGLHGKQLGLSGGAGYDGGRGQQARENGDGWSVRLQFDSNPEHVTNNLYVYQSQMTGTYGGPHGARKFELSRGKWHEIQLTVTMQSNASAADGRIRVWRDGELMIDVADIRFVTQEKGRNINRVRFETFPGGGGAFPSRDSWIEYDDVEWGGS